MWGPHLRVELRDLQRLANFVISFYSNYHSSDKGMQECRSIQSWLLLNRLQKKKVPDAKDLASGRIR